jgi:two-component system, cell cycle sensor histidine kinase and response regulator CckA
MLGPWEWAIDVVLLVATLLAVLTDALVFWFHIVFVVLTVSAMFLGTWAFALRAVVWVPVVTVIVATAVHDEQTQPEELVEIPLLSSILFVVFIVSLWRARALEDLKRAQALLEEKHRSERSELERELEISRKMDALGRLAGGIAHDFNNVLTAVLGHCEDLIDNLDGHPGARPAREIEAAVSRASSLVDDLMSFSRQHVRQPTIVDINEILTSVAAMLEPLIGEDVVLDVRLSSSRCLAHVDRNRFEQVVVNLAVNARDAMPRGGRLEFTTGIVELGADHPAAHELPSGPHTTMTVTDNGVGISPHDVGRIFEPFFTTKDAGRGAGLGLATVRDIVCDSGGTVTVDSEVARGTRFTVYLPVPVGEVVPDMPQPRVDSVTGGSETVLLIEDDAAVRARARNLLMRGGYKVLEAPDGERALELAAVCREPIHLLVTDVVMPGMDGPSVARRLNETRPDTRVLFVSGYTKERVAPPWALDGKAEILAKPFTRDELLARARMLLDRS